MQKDISALVLFVFRLHRNGEVLESDWKADLVLLRVAFV